MTKDELIQLNKNHLMRLIVKLDKDIFLIQIAGKFFKAEIIQTSKKFPYVVGDFITVNTIKRILPY
jgi:hypothetical protein